MSILLLPTTAPIDSPATASGSARNPVPTPFRLSGRAAIRINQRGVTQDALDLVCRAADRVVHLNCGLRVVSLSARKAERLRKPCGNALVSRAARLQLVVDVFTDTILTVTKGETYRPASHKPRRRLRR